MQTERIKINNIPSIIWGKSSSRVFIAIHGNMSNKEDKVIEMLAQKCINYDYQVISFDLPEHGERKDDKECLCVVQNCIKDLKEIIRYAKDSYNEINIFACSMGAYFGLLSYKCEKINKCLFLSPIVNMKILIDNMMLWSNTNEELLKEKQKVETDFGQTLYWDYYEYVKENPITKWNTDTYILYGDKDNMQDKKIIKDFSKKYNCKLDILENGEHYFHTEEQLKYYEKWLEEVII